jgi:hypothetical protein
LHKNKKKQKWETQQWELRLNAQLENLNKKENIVQFIKSIRMQ